ncbi:MAG: DUF4845 domain-containing protein [Gammaproteobacteria bacterium]|nr:DUF4845 domain-containing protein [Gammaproteobacteria bacterium]MBU1980038.1 DUF4845 domain-containing protein [Gammaproteobacteria bacterium]
MKKQQGATLLGMLFIAALVGSGLVLAAKLVPAYLEFMSVKRILSSMATSGDLKTMSPKELETSFFKRADVGDVKSVKPEDLTVSREGSLSVVSVDYSIKVPVVANVSACMDFSASSSAKSE